MSLLVENDGQAESRPMRQDKPSTTQRHRIWQGTATSDFGLLVASALANILLHTLVNGQYGFHRDELLTLDNARQAQLVAALAVGIGGHSLVHGSFMFYTSFDYPWWRYPCSFR
jgi:hypothetical protein